MDNGKKDSRERYSEKVSKTIKQRYRDILIRGMKFLVHFIVVMILLYCSAMIFAVLEDPAFSSMTSSSPYSTNNNTDSTMQGNQSLVNISVFLRDMEAKYNTSMGTDLREEFREDIRTLLEQMVEKTELVTQEKEIKVHKNHDRHYVFMKWFSFVTIATTTIGYGQVYPQTDNGKLFYIFFSIVGIALMMTLLKSCGAILTDINEKVNAKINHCILRDKKLVSNELMTIVSITIMFIIFMLFVAWHDQSIGDAKDWSLLEGVYFWIVTFTTVGFGDMHFSLDVEVDHVYELVFYRVLGLSFLASIIDSIQRYTKYRNKALVRTISHGSTHIKHKLKNKVVIIERRKSLIRLRGTNAHESRQCDPECNI